MYTIKHSKSLSGLGIHSGKQVTLRFEPGTPKHGIRFIREDHNNSIIHMRPDNLSSTPRATCLTENQLNIKTPEHVLAACAGLNIQALDIYIDNEEVPICDGSAQDFSLALLDAELSPLAQKQEPYIITEPVFVTQDDACIIGLPSEISQFSYHLSYPDTFIGSQKASLSVTQDAFLKEIAPARTYAFYNEVKSLLDQNLGQGGNLDCVVVIQDEDYMNELRFENELSRHKLLDLMGDCWVLGRPIQGHVIGLKSGHALTKEFVLNLK